MSATRNPLHHSNRPALPIKSPALPIIVPGGLQGHHEGVAGHAGGGPGGAGHGGAGLHLLPHHSAGTGVLHEHGHCDKLCLCLTGVRTFVFLF